MTKVCCPNVERASCGEGKLGGLTHFIDRDTLAWSVEDPEINMIGAEVGECGV